MARSSKNLNQLFTGVTNKGYDSILDIEESIQCPTPQKLGPPPSSQQMAPSFQHLIPSPQHLERLKQIAAEVRNKGKVPKQQLISVILAICSDYYISSRELSDLVRRTPDTLRNHYLNELVAQGKLELMYPNKPSDPRQRYRTKTN